MEYTKQELKEIKELEKSHPVISKLLLKLRDYEEDPAHIFHIAVKKVVKKFSGDIDDIIGSTGNVFSTKDDKVFERLKSVATDGEKIFKSLRIGKEDINPEAAAKEKQKSKEKEDETLALPKA